MAEPTTLPNSTYTIERYGRHWAVRDRAGALVCLTVYRRGAAEVCARLEASRLRVHGKGARHV